MSILRGWYAGRGGNGGRVLKHLTLEYCGTAKAATVFDQSKHASALILLVVSLSKSTNRCAHPKNGMSNCLLANAFGVEI